MSLVEPESAAALAEALREAASREAPIELGGAFTKRALGGPTPPADAARITTRAMKRVLAYEPADLTISVEAGMPVAELSGLLAKNGQMLPLDPPWQPGCTVGGSIAVDASGPRRRGFGAARDLVIGMTFCTVEGKQVQSGGMVVKNVTGLDMGKLMIGSFGTLAAVASVNFKVLPKPKAAATFVFESDSSDALVKLRHAVLQSQVQPAAIDLLNAASLEALGLEPSAEYVLLAEATGSEAVVGRYEREYAAMAQAGGLEMVTLDQDRGGKVWEAVRELRARAAEGWTSVRVTTPATRLAEALRTAFAGDGRPLLLCRAANGVLHLLHPEFTPALQAVGRLRKAGFKTLVEQLPDDKRGEVEAWTESSSAFGVMGRIKKELDPDGALNPGRLFGKL